MNAVARDQPIETEHEAWGRQAWAAVMLTSDLAVCRSILEGLLVRAGGLDAFVLRRALRGAPLPPAESYVLVTAEMLDAVAEAGPIPRHPGTCSPLLARADKKVSPIPTSKKKGGG
jgi:hypothetical protein